MDRVVNVVSAALHLALFIGGVVVALTLRRRDPRAALLAALGFGCALLSNIVGFGQVFLAPRILSEAQQTTFFVVGLVARLIELAGLLLILLGLLRLVRRRGPVAPGMGGR